MEEGRALAQVKPTNIEKMPIRMLRNAENDILKNINSLVDSLAAHSLNIRNSKGNEKDQIQRQIDQTDKEIDELVYKLYGITEEEKKIIEA